MSIKAAIRTSRLRAIKRASEIEKNERVIMIASLIKGGKIIKTCNNDYRRLSFPNKKRNHYSTHSGLHAEIALINACTKKQLTGATIVVYGIAVGQNLENKATIQSTKPCLPCITAINAVGISKVNFIENNKWITRKVSDMIKEYYV